MQEQVERLLAEGRKTQHEIAIVVGVSDTDVQEIAAQLDIPEKRPGQLGLCPRCGFKVYLPCVACQLATKNHVLTTAPAKNGYGLDLRPEHYARYLEVLARHGRQPLDTHKHPKF
jgi:hypothetical protein